MQKEYGITIIKDKHTYNYFHVLPPKQMIETFNEYAKNKTLEVCVYETDTNKLVLYKAAGFRAI